MNVDNVRNIEEAENLKDLCEKLDEKYIARGKGRKLLEARIKRYINYEKIPHSNRLIIYGVYDEPLPLKSSKCIGNNSKYISDMEIIIRFHLQKNSIIGKTVTELGVIFGLIDRKHSYYSILQRVFFRKEGVKIKRIYLWIPITYYERMDVTYRSIVKSAIRNLARRNIISITCASYCKQADEEVSRPLSEYETHIINRILAYVEKKMHGGALEIVYKESKPKSYNRIKRERIMRLVRRILGISYTFEKYSLSLQDKSFIVTKQEFSNSMISLKKLFNERCVKEIDKQIKYIQDKYPNYLEEACIIKDLFIKSIFNP